MCVPQGFEVECGWLGSRWWGGVGWGRTGSDGQRVSSNFNLVTVFVDRSGPLVRCSGLTCPTCAATCCSLTAIGICSSGKGKFLNNLRLYRGWGVRRALPLPRCSCAGRRVFQRVLRGSASHKAAPFSCSKFQHVVRSTLAGKRSPIKF